MKSILLTFDVEECEYFKGEEQFEKSKQGLLSISDLLSKHNLRATFFTTALFAKKYPSIIKELSQEHEIACHSYSHSEPLNPEKIKQAKQELEKITKQKIRGFRAPRFQIKNIHELNNIGFDYDSSIHPTWIPGRYMNLNKKRNIHKIGNLIEIPLSTLPIIRLPIFWLAFKNSPHIYHRTFTKINFTSSPYLMMIFHPWEFADLSKINIPKFIKRKHSQKLLNSLNNYIQYSKTKYKFDTISRFLNLSQNPSNAQSQL